MKKLNKDFIYLSILILTFIVLSVYTMGTTHLFGSNIDWYAQHISIPEYFRTLFYDTKDLFPDFALNIGNGQNIYNFSYYGLLSPTILLSYLFPFINMIHYLVIIIFITIIASTILMYKFLRKHNFSEEVSFMATLCFVLSSPIVFHSHRHYMFINYLPFVLMGLFGVDKKMKEGKSWLLALSVFLMVMTSYYYSIGGILCLFVYALYVFLQKNKKISIKSFFKTLFFIAGPVVIGVVMSTIITIPTLLTMFSNRLDTNISVSLLDLILPKPDNIKNLLYFTYSLGLPTLAVPALINFFKKDKANITLGIILVCLFLFNIINFALNGTMYIDAKSLIPFLPLYIYVIAEFFKDLFNKEVHHKQLLIPLVLVSIWIVFSPYAKIHYLIDIVLLIVITAIYYKFPKKLIIMIPLFFLLLGNAYMHNLSDTLELRYEIKEDETIINDSLNIVINGDDNFYRTAVDYSKGDYPNKIFENIKYRNSTIYSSISNSNYNKLYFDVLSNNMAHRNRALTTTTTNIINLMLSGNKYVITPKAALQGYELINSDNGLNIYRNNNVLPIAFANANIMSYSDYEKLNFFQEQEALLNVIVTDNHSNNNFVSNVTKVDFDITEAFIKAGGTLNEDGSISLKNNESVKSTIEIPKKYQNKILFIRFQINNNASIDRSIKINTIENKITNSSWKYYNGNTVFDYVINFQNQKELSFHISKGQYELSNFEVHTLDYSYLEQASKKVDRLIVDNNKTKGDKIIGDINVTNDGYFMLTTPYSPGFNIKIDGNKVDYEKVDYAFVGFPIKEGQHHIEIEFKAPGKNLALLTSSLGLIAYIAVIIIEKKRKI